MKAAIITLLSLSLCFSPTFAMININPPEVYPSGTMPGGHFDLSSNGNQGTFELYNSNGVKVAWGTVVYTSTNGTPTIVVGADDKDGNHLSQTVVETDLGNRFHYQYASTFNGTSYSHYIDIPKAGGTVDLTADAQNYASLVAFKNAISGAPKIKNVTADLSTQYQNDARTEARPLMVVGCVALATGGLVVTALGCVTVVLCFGGLAIANAGILMCAAS